MNETMLLDAGMQTLVNTLGSVEAERFIALILREPFDYTQWRQQNLCAGMSVEQISAAAAQTAVAAGINYE
jgi:hypothetical protein